MTYVEAIAWLGNKYPWYSIDRKINVVNLAKSLKKGGPYIGPRGGKYADPKHTIPWKENQEKPRFKIGTKFIRATGKRKDVETIEDIHTTINYKGEVVGIKYVTSHIFAGQKVTDSDVPEATIARAIIAHGKIK